MMFILSLVVQNSNTKSLILLEISIRPKYQISVFLIILIGPQKTLKSQRLFWTLALLAFLFLNLFLYYTRRLLVKIRC